MICERELYDLEAAKEAGAFVRLGSDAEDFAVNFNLAWIIYDSIGTYACIKAEPELTLSQISKAWLTDDLDRAQPLADVFEISAEAARAAGYPDHRLVLFFGPISPEAKRIRLEIQRLEPAGQGLQYFNSVIDPFSNLCDEKALHIMAWEEPDDPMAMIPMGTVAGCWDFNVDCPRRNQAWELSKVYKLNKEITIGSSTICLDELQQGLTGWRLKAHFPSKANRSQNIDKLIERLWKVGHPDELIYDLDRRGLLEYFSPPKIRCALLAGGQAAENTETYGPLGPLNNRFYFFFRPYSESGLLPDKLRIDKIVELPLKESWIYSFDPKNIQAPPADIDVKIEPFDIKLKFSLEGLYWADDMMLVAPIVVMGEDCNVNVDFGDCLLRDLRSGEAHFCLGQTLVDLPQPKTSVRREQAYGWQYPPVHLNTREASFEVCTVNIIPNEPVLFDINPTLKTDEPEDEEETGEENAEAEEETL